MNWADFLTDKSSLEAVYGTLIPDLKSICIREISFDENGPSMKLRFDFPAFPANPPTKWTQSGFNTVQCVLVVDQVFDVSMRGWSTNNVGDIKIEAVELSKFEVEFASKPSQFSVTCKSIWLQKISAYLNTETKE